MSSNYKIYILGLFGNIPIGDEARYDYMTTNVKG